MSTDKLYGIFPTDCLGASRCIRAVKALLHIPLVLIRHFYDGPAATLVPHLIMRQMEGIMTEEETLRRGLCGRIAGGEGAVVVGTDKSPPKSPTKAKNKRL